MADGSIPGHTLDELRAPMLQRAARQAREQGSRVRIFIQPARDATGAELPRVSVETIVIDDEHAMQSIGGRAPIVGEWRSRELTLLVYGEAEALRYTLFGQLLR